MLAGKPNPTTFPFSSIDVKIKPAFPGGETLTLTIDEEALTDGLQYGPTAGLNKLHEWLNQLQTKVHKRPEDNTWRLTIGSGSQDLIYKVSFGLFLVAIFELMRLSIGFTSSHQRRRFYPPRDSCLSVRRHHRRYPRADESKIAELSVSSSRNQRI